MTFYLYNMKITSYDNDNSCHINGSTNNKILLIRTYRFKNLVFIAFNEHASVNDTVPISYENELSSIY